MDENLKNLKISHEHLIVLGMLTGTDFNYGGIKGIGPKTALKLVSEYPSDFDSLFEKVKWDDSFNFGWREVFEIFEKIEVTEDYRLEWKKPSKERMMHILVDEHDFSRERVEKTADEITDFYEKNSQEGLKKWF